MRIKKEFEISLNDAKRIQKFSDIVRKYDFNIEAGSKERKLTVDAKSILGIMTLDLSKPIVVTIFTNDKEMIDDFASEMDNFV